MWIEANEQFTYKIVLADNAMPGVAAGVYTLEARYHGIDDNAGYKLFYCTAGMYIISNKIGDDIALDSNYPNIESGTYSVDTSKKPNNSTVYKNVSGKYIVINSGNDLVYYGDYLIPNDQKHERVRFDRNGNDLTFQRVFESGQNKFEQVDIVAQTLADTRFIVTDEEYSQGIYYDDIVNAAFAAFDAKGYYYTFTPAGSFSGWYSNSLLGTFEAFGSATGQKIVGHFKYRDVNNNEYIKTKEIAESNSVWSVQSKINNAVYTSSPEPTDSDITFTNSEADPTTLQLTFDGYVALPKSQILTMTADDLV